MALTTSGIRTTVFGDMRIVIGKITDVTNTADEFDTGLDYVYFCEIVDIEDDEALRVVLNSNDGTEGTANGYVYTSISQRGTTGTDDCMFFAIGK